jgi:hypothetical protein
MACNIMPTYRAITIENEIAAFHCARYVDDGYGATTMCTENICEKFLLRVSRNRVP